VKVNLQQQVEYIFATGLSNRAFVICVGSAVNFCLGQYDLKCEAINRTSILYSSPCLCTLQQNGNKIANPAGGCCCDMQHIKLPIKLRGVGSNSKVRARAPKAQGSRRRRRREGSVWEGRSLGRGLCPFSRKCFNFRLNIVYFDEWWQIKCPKIASKSGGSTNTEPSRQKVGPKPPSQPPDSNAYAITTII